MTMHCFDNKLCSNRFGNNARNVSTPKVRMLETDLTNKSVMPVDWTV